MTTVTLKDIKANSPCELGWVKLLKHLGKTKADTAPLELVEILKSNGLDDALWCLRALPKEMDGKIRLFNCLIAERALQYWEKQYPDDKRPHEAIAISRRYAVNKATKAELADARDAARAAAWDAAGAVAGAAAWDAAGDAARAAECKAQEELFIQYWGQK